jgi:lysophospholipase L1-like esterase
MGLSVPGVSVPAFTRAVNGGLRVRPLTEAQRAAVTPPAGDVIAVSDTGAYYVGDGATAGGVASATGLSTQQAIRLGIIQPRTHDFLSRLRGATAGFKAFAVGNSIVQGSGATTSNDVWTYKLAGYLQAETTVGVTNDWAPVNVGVGGSQILVPIGYAADYLGTDGVVTAGLSRSTRYGLGLVMTMRNDTSTSKATFNQRARVLIRAMTGICEDVAIVSEPPQINYTTGAVLDAGGWANVTQVMQEVAADYGCTYVDVWAKWMLEYRAGCDLRTRMADGTHPNDIGHAMIGQMVFQALMAPVAQRSAPVLDRGVTGESTLTVPLASYTPVTASVGTSSFSGLVTATTARRRQLAEGSNVAYALTSGQTARFDVPLPIYRVRPVVVQGTGGTGTLALDGVSLGAAFSASSAGSALEIPANTYAPATPGPGVLLVTSTHASNTLRLLGMQFDTPQALDQHAVWPGATESGTWGDTTFAATGVATGSAARSSAAVGDYVDITWYGAYLTFVMETGTDRGKISESTDGGSTTTHDAYAATGSYLYRCTPLQALGWHTTRLTVATKNASSSANTVALGFYRTCIPPEASIGYATVAAGETMQLHGKWRTAAIDRVLSGSPYVSGWTPGATALAVAGTGAAIVRLAR